MSDTTLWLAKWDGAVKREDADMNTEDQPEDEGSAFVAEILRSRLTVRSVTILTYPRLKDWSLANQRSKTWCTFRIHEGTLVPA